MSKELEALERIKRNHIVLYPNKLNEDNSIYKEIEFQEEFDILETALEKIQDKHYLELNNTIIRIDNILSAGKNWVDGTPFHYKIDIIYTNGQKISIGYEYETKREKDFNLLKEVML